MRRDFGRIHGRAATKANDKPCAERSDAVRDFKDDAIGRVGDDLVEDFYVKPCCVQRRQPAIHQAECVNAFIRDNRNAFIRRQPLDKEIQFRSPAGRNTNVRDCFEYVHISPNSNFVILGLVPRIFSAMSTPVLEILGTSPRMTGYNLAHRQNNFAHGFAVCQLIKGVGEFFQRIVIADTRGNPAAL